MALQTNPVAGALEVHPSELYRWRRELDGLVQHSDRGVQYAAGSYTQWDNGITISMSRKGNPWDKAYPSHCTSIARCTTS